MQQPIDGKASEVTQIITEATKVRADLQDKKKRKAEGDAQPVAPPTPGAPPPEAGSGSAGSGAAPSNGMEAKIAAEAARLSDAKIRAKQQSEKETRGDRGAS